MTAGNFGGGLGGAGINPAGTGTGVADIARFDPMGGAAGQATVASQVPSASITVAQAQPPATQTSVRLDPAIRSVGPAEVSPAPHQSTSALGNRILERLDAMQRNGEALAGNSKATPAGNQPTLKVASLTPGPAEKYLAATPAAPGLSAGARPDGSLASLEDSFRRIMEQNNQMSLLVTEVGMAVKAVGSFTGTVKQVMSSQ